MKPRNRKPPVRVQLDALDGVSFVTRPDGTIEAVGAAHWNGFAAENGAPHLTADSIVGRNLFDYVAGAEVQALLRAVLQQLATRRRPTWAAMMRCDAPHRLRHYRQSITPILEAGVCNRLLFQSIEIESRARPQIGLFDFKALATPADQDAGLPLIVMCSWCQRVRSVTVTGNRWLEAEAYYAEGGRSNVTISHGICPDCSQTLRV